MMIRFIVLCIGLISIAANSVQHPTGFITLDECVTKEASVAFPFAELDEDAPKQFVLALDQGSVVGSGAIITKDGKLLRDTETYKEDQHGLLVAGRDITQRNQLFFDGSLAVISSPGQQCYYHWLLQVLIRGTIKK